MLSSTTPIQHDPWCSCRTIIQYLDSEPDYRNERSVPVAFRPLDSMLPELVFSFDADEPWRLRVALDEDDR